MAIRIYSGMFPLVAAQSQHCHVTEIISIASLSSQSTSNCEVAECLENWLEQK